MFVSRETNGTISRKEYNARLKAMFAETTNIDLEERKILKAAQDVTKDHGPTQSRRANFIRKQEALKRGASQGAKKRLSAEEYADVKRKKKENDVLRKEWPRILVNDEGKMSSLSVEGERVPLFMGDVQSLLLYSLLANKAPSVPRFANCVNVVKVPSVVMVHIEGVGLNDVRLKRPSLSGDSTSNGTAENGEKGTMEHQEGNASVGQNRVTSSGGLPEWLKSSLPRTSSILHHSLEVIAPSIHGACPVEELLEVKVEKNTVGGFDDELGKLEKESEPSKKFNPCSSFFRFLSAIPPNPKDELHPHDSFSRLKLLLTPVELFKNRFPLPLPGFRGSTNPEFVLTSDNYKEVTSRSPMFGVDCEMCLTSIQKLELASISVVNEMYEVVYCSLVLPKNPIVNFMTKYSGITPQMLLHVTKRLEDVQADLQKLLPGDAILVGHSLNSDLNAMKMMHPYVIDSSVAYNLTGDRFRRSSLKYLSEIFLDVVIQNARESGHNPTEDACASLKLIQWKLRNDETYGNMLLGWLPPSASPGAWKEVKPDAEGQQQQFKKDFEKGTNDQQPKQDGKLLNEEAIGPFRRKNISIFQKMNSVSTAIITTPQCLKSYLGVLTSLNNVPTVEVLPGHKQVSQRAMDFTSNTNLTCIHIKMGKKLQQCPNEATWQEQLTKLDKRLQRIYKSALPKSIHIYLFSGSSPKVPLRDRSNGFVLIGVKDLPLST